MPWKWGVFVTFWQDWANFYQKGMECLWYWDSLSNKEEISPPMLVKYKQNPENYDMDKEYSKNIKLGKILEYMMINDT